MLNLFSYMSKKKHKLANLVRIYLPAPESYCDFKSGEHSGHPEGPHDTGSFKINATEHVFIHV